MEKQKLLILTAVSIESQAVAKALKIALQPARSVRRYCGPELDLYQIGVGGARLPVDLTAGLSLNEARPPDSLSRVPAGEGQGGGSYSSVEDPHPTLPRSTGRGGESDASPQSLQQHGQQPVGDGQFCGIILAGLAGALDPSLGVGDVVVESFPADAWGELPYRRGLIHTADSIVSTPTDKAELYRRTGALAVEMEAAVVRKLSDLLGLPLLSLRAISDIADESLDPSVVGFMDEFGEPRPGAIVAAMVRRPRIIGPTVRLARNARCAADSLTAAIRFLGEKNLLRPTTGVRASHADGGF